MKNAQVTPIIILAIVVILGIGIYYMLPGNNVQNIEPSVKPIYNFVQNCLEIVTGSSILEVSETGGYYDHPEYVLGDGVPYYLYEGKNYQPSKEQVEKEISKHIENQLIFCLDDFSNFPDFVIEKADVKSEIKIEDNRVVSNIKMPLTIIKEDSTYHLENFESIVKVRLGIILGAIDFLMKDQMQHQESLCILCGHDISTTYDLTYRTVNIDEGILFFIGDPNVLINEEELVFIFANKLEEL